MRSCSFLLFASLTFFYKSAIYFSYLSSSGLVTFANFLGGSLATTGSDFYKFTMAGWSFCDTGGYVTAGVDYATGFGSYFGY